MAIIHNNNKLLIRIYLKIHFKKKTKKEKPETRFSGREAALVAIKSR